MQTRRFWRRGAALAGGLVVGFVCVSALRRAPYDAPTTLTRLYHYDGLPGCEDVTSEAECWQKMQGSSPTKEEMRANRQRHIHEPPNRRLQESEREKAIRLEQHADDRAAAALRGVVGLGVITDAALNGDAHWARIAALSLVTTLGYDVLGAVNLRRGPRGGHERRERGQAQAERHRCASIRDAAGVFRPRRPPRRQSSYHKKLCAKPKLSTRPYLSSNRVHHSPDD